MLKNVFRVASLFALLPFLVQPLNAEVIKMGVGTSPGSSFPPYTVLMPDQKSYNGVVYEILDAILKVTGDAVEPVYMPAARIFPGVSDGTIDLDLFSNPAWRKEYARDSIYTRYYLHTRNFFVFRMDQPTRVRVPEDLKGKTLLLVHGFHYPELDRLLDDGSIARDDAPSTALLLTMLDNKRDEVGVVDGAVFHQLVKNLGITSLRLGDPVGPPIEVSMRFSKKKASVVNRFNDALNLLHKNGRLAKILARYGLEDY